MQLEVVQLCWTMSSSAESLFFSTENCYKHFLHLISSYADLGLASGLPTNASVFNDRLLSLTCLFHDELEYSSSRVDRSLHEGRQSTQRCPLLYLVYLKLMHCESSFPDNASSSTTIPSHLQFDQSLEWTKDDVAHLSVGLQDNQCQDQNVCSGNEVRQ